VNNIPGPCPASTTEALKEGTAATSQLYNKNENGAAVGNNDTRDLFRRRSDFFLFAFLSFATARFLSQSRAADGGCWQRWHFNKTS